VNADNLLPPINKSYGPIFHLWNVDKNWCTLRAEVKTSKDDYLQDY
jgi:hypothetical protein